MKLGETKIALVEKDEKGIVHITLKRLIEVNAEDVEEYIQSCLKIAKGQSKPVLFDTREVESYTPLAMKKLIDPRTQDLTKASAVLLNSKSPLTAIAVSFILKISREPFPIRVFTDKKEALLWLEQFV